MNDVRKFGEELRAKRAQLIELAKKTKEANYEAGLMAEMEAKGAEVEELQAKYDAAAAVAAAERDNDVALKNLNLPTTSVAQGGSNGEAKSLGEIFTEADAFKGYKRGSSGSFAVEVNAAFKTLLSTVNGFAPDSPRTNRIVESVQQRPTLASIIPSVNTNLQTIKYMEEVLYDNQASSVAEGGLLAESGFRFQEVSTAVKKIGTFIPVTEEQLEDVPQVQSIINNRLMLMLQQKEEGYLLNGDGIGANILGFLNHPTILAQAVGADTRIDAVQKAIEKVETAGVGISQAAIATAVIMHPSRWGEILRQKDNDGRYMIGDPQSGAVGARLWGVPVVVTSLIPANTAFTGDFRLFSQISRRSNMTIEAGYINDQFIQGVQSMKITERIALEIYRGAAFCRITGF